MLVPVVIFANVMVPDGTADHGIAAAIELALGPVRANVGVVGWEIVREEA